MSAGSVVLRLESWRLKPYKDEYLSLVIGSCLASSLNDFFSRCYDH